jgi:hypothetical protein
MPDDVELIAEVVAVVAWVEVDDTTLVVEPLALAVPVAALPPPPEPAM